MQHPHFNKLFDVAYPMRAPYVLQQAQQDPVCRDVLRLVNKEVLLFKERPDAPLSGIGEPASRQVILYAVMAWPPHTTYAATTLESGVPDVVADLSDNFMTTKLPGVEMASRLLATNPVWYDPLVDGNTMGGALAGPLIVCACTICRDMAATRRLPPARYHSSPRITEVAAELAAAGCATGQSIANSWTTAVRRWVGDIF